MTVKSSGTDAAARAAQEAARRAAEAARKAAEARQKAAAAAAAAAAQKSQAASAAQQARTQLAQKAGTRPTASAVRQAFGKNEFSTGLARAMKQRLGLTNPPATNLHTEVLGDGKTNCLERAVRTAKPGDQVVLLADQQDSVGHAVVERPDGTVVDPNRPKQPYSSLDAYLKENPATTRPRGCPT